MAIDGRAVLRRTAAGWLFSKRSSARTGGHTRSRATRPRSPAGAGLLRTVNEYQVRAVEGSIGVQVYPEASSQDFGRAAGWEAADRVGVLNADDADQLLFRGGFGFGRAHHSQRSMRAGSLAASPGTVL